MLKEDILRFIGEITPAAPAPSVRTFAPLADDRVVPIRGYTRAMMKTMTVANTIPHFGYGDEVVVDRLVDLREQLKRMAKERGIKMSYMPLFIKAASMALHEYPVLNARIDDAQENIVYLVRFHSGLTSYKEFSGFTQHLRGDRHAGRSRRAQHQVLRATVAVGDRRRA